MPFEWQYFTDGPIVAREWMLAGFRMFAENAWYIFSTKIVSEYDQEIPQSQTADNPVAPRGRAAQPPRDTRKTN